MCGHTARHGPVNKAYAIRLNDAYLSVSPVREIDLTSPMKTQDPDPQY
jgi:hypothetical protein